MRHAALRSGPDGRLMLEGELSFETVVRLLGEMRRQLDQGTEIQVDLQGVSRADSAGLALLVEWMRNAKALGKSIQYLNIPQQMLDIARVSGLDQVLPLSRG